MADFEFRGISRSEVMAKVDGYRFKLLMGSNVVYDFDLSTLCGTCGTVSAATNVDSRNNIWFAATVGKNNDIAYFSMFGLIPTTGKYGLAAQHVFDLGNQGCGVDGLKSSIDFDGDVAELTFGVKNPLCKREVFYNYDSGKLQMRTA